MNHYKEKLASLRLSMREKGKDVYIIPDSDPHLSEYIPDHWRIMRWLSGFTGSAGTLVITETFAGLLTDSRYIVQAEKQLEGSGFVLIKPVRNGRYDIADWLSENIDQGSLIALDGRLFSITRIRRIKKALEGKNISIDTDSDLITDLWSDRPPLPTSPAFDHPVKFSGKNRSEKLGDLRNEMKRMKVDYHLLTSPDDIMWLLNIRGNDIKYNPLLLSWAIADIEQILLFVEESKIPFPVAMEFDRLGIVMLPYEEIDGMLTTLPENSSILISPASTSATLFNSIPSTLKIVEDISIPAKLKSIKNHIEIENLENAMIRDGVALTGFFHWIEKNFDTVPMSELSITEKLFDFRSAQENFIGLSFSSIVAYNEHAALPHYSADASTDSEIHSEGILLVDSGSQYFDGTTDITRTIILGKPTEAQKTDFTLVLRGMINLAKAKFPMGTNGYQLDALARRPLWEKGLNYGHGTGHGVGYCLNVHEGPQSISPVAIADRDNSLKPGMLTSDEPGVYRPGEYGIRTENLILCEEDQSTKFGDFLRFRTLSLCYIDRNLIDNSMLDYEEIEWIDSYHRAVFDKLSPYLNEEESAWLKGKTLPLNN
jgi:Xaa-Pro aminopeptidase